MRKIKKIMALSIVILILGSFFTSPVMAWQKSEQDKPISVYPAGNIHLHDYVYRVAIENYGQGHILIVLYPEGGSSKERKEIYLIDWQNFMEEVRKINSIALMEKTKEVLTVKEFLQLKSSLEDLTVRVRGTTKNVEVKKALLFYYTLFLLTDKQGNSFKVSWQGKYQVPEGKEVTVKGEYNERGKEFVTNKVTW